MSGLFGIVQDCHLMKAVNVLFVSLLTRRKFKTFLGQRLQRGPLKAFKYLKASKQHPFETPGEGLSVHI